MVDVTEINDVRIGVQEQEPSLPQIPRLPEDCVMEQKFIGHGGFGSVYQGIFQGVPVAIKKIMAPHLSADAANEMVQSELKLLVRLRHSNFVCQVIGYYQAAQILSIVTTLAENGNLQKYLIAGHLVGDWSTKARICSDIAKAVASVHAENIIHGDLKAENILLDKSLTPKLTDFGISKSFSSLSGGSRISGTLRYVAPERLLYPDKKFNHTESMLSDTYGYGLVLWETAMDGMMPYEDMDDIGIRIAKIQQTNPLQYVGNLSDETPQVFQDLIIQYLDRDFSSRPSLTLALHEFDVYIRANPIIHTSYPNALSPTTEINTVSAMINPFRDCELFTKDEIGMFSESQQIAYNDILHYFREKMYGKAIEHLKSSEVFHHPVAQRVLGLCYQANDEGYEAFLCFKKSALNDAKGQFFLAWCFDYGYGTDCDEVGALMLYAMSAAHGVVEAAKALHDARWFSRIDTDQQRAIGVRDTEIAVLLRDKISIIDDAGLTLLHWVSQNGHVNVTRLLVTEFEADANVRTNDGWTPLHLAAQNEHIEVIRLLVELGADVNAKSNTGLTPLHLAAQYGHVQVARLLVAKFGADVNAKDNDGNNSDGEKDRLASLCKLDSDIIVRDNNGRTPLHYAVGSGHIEVVVLLVGELGADANVKDTNGWTPLHYAAWNGQIEIVKLLSHELGADIDAEAKNGWMPLHYAVANRHIEVVRLLIGEDANAKDKHEQTPLHFVAEKGQIEMVNLPIGELGVDINVKDKIGLTPLRYAVWFRSNRL